MNRWIEFDENGYVTTEQEGYYSDTCVRNEWEAEIGDQLELDGGVPIGLVNPHRKEITLREFILMLTPQELRLVKAKTNTDDDILHFWEIAKADRTIDLRDPVAISGMAKLVDRNVLTQERHDIIMLGIPI